MLYLPIKTIETEIQKSNINNDKYSWKSKTILIVEDVEINISFLKALLENTQASITVKKNGIEAVELCKSGFVPDIILMDIQMPEMNGIEATQEIRKFLKTTPIIAQTAYASENDKELALAAGCNDYFSKPLNSDELLNRMNQFLSAGA